MRNIRIKSLVLTLLTTTTLAGSLIATPAFAGVPGSTASINLDASGLALDGYDPVAYFDTGKPTRGAGDDHRVV